MGIQNYKDMKQEDTIEILATKPEYRFIKRTRYYTSKKPIIDYCIEKRMYWENMPEGLIRYAIIYFNRSKTKVERRFLFEL